jgi:hypothetical protein
MIVKVSNEHRAPSFLAEKIYGVISQNCPMHGNDFKTGQVAQVMPGQHAATSSSGNAGLSLGGTGTLQPIEHGQPRASTIDRVHVPRNHVLIAATCARGS